MIVNFDEYIWETELALRNRDEIIYVIGEIKI